MFAPHHETCFSGTPHIFHAHGTIARHGRATRVVGGGHWYAHIARIAMLKVFSAPHTANPTRRTVVHSFCWRVVVVQMANGAVVRRKRNVTGGACIGGRLTCVAFHADNFGHVVPVHRVCLFRVQFPVVHMDRVVAETTRVGFPAARCD